MPSWAYVYIFQDIKSKLFKEGWPAYTFLCGITNSASDCLIRECNLKQSQPNPMLGVLKITISMVPNFEVHKTHFKPMDRKYLGDNCIKTFNRGGI